MGFRIPKPIELHTSNKDVSLPVKFELFNKKYTKIIQNLPSFLEPYIQ